jgi:anti-sigma regulatory factor (Ser/Thr protein kinase)
VDARASYPAELASATAARHFAEQTLSDWGCPDLVEDARLLVSELVINSVLHARSPVQLRLNLDKGILRVEVRDESPDLPVQRKYSLTAPTGRGLMIVDAVADRWGVEAADTHKVAWFELDADQFPADSERVL